MNRNCLSPWAHSAVSSPLATHFPNPLTLLGAFFLCLAPALASAQGVTLQSGSANLGSANVCPSDQTTHAPCSNTVTLTYSVDAGTTIGGVGIFTTGAKNLDFQAKAGDTSTTLCSAQTYSSATTCTVDVTFAPLAPGQRKGAVQFVDGSGNVLSNTYIYGTGVGPEIAFSPAAQAVLGGSINNANGVAVDASGNVFAVDLFYGEVKEILAAGGYTIVKTLTSGLHPYGLAVDGSGDLFISEGNAVEEILAVNGSIPANPTIQTLSTDFVEPNEVAVDGSGNVFVADGGGDSGGNSVKEIVAAGGYTKVRRLGSGFGQAFGVAVDASGNVFVASYGIGPVYEIVAINGSIPDNPTIKPFGKFFLLIGVAVDASGNVFVAQQSDNAAVYEIAAVNGSIPANPTITSLGGGFQFLAGIAEDGSGNVFVADYGNNAVDEIQRSQPPSLGFAATIVGSTSSDSPQSVQIQNVGNTTLTGSGTLNDSIDFTVVAGPGIFPDCPPEILPLAPGAECNVSFDFTPQLPELLDRTLTLSDNSLNGNPATQTIHLMGTGHHASQTIDFPTIEPQTALTPLDHLYATVSSGLPITFASNTPDVCTISGIRADFLTAGSCDLIATQAGNTEYFAAITGQTFLVHHRRQVITFGPIAPQPVGTMLTLTATTDSELPITYASTTPTICSVSGSTASLLNTGTCTIQASQAGDATYFASGPKAQSFTVE